MTSSTVLSSLRRHSVMAGFFLLFHAGAGLVPLQGRQLFLIHLPRRSNRFTLFPSFSPCQEGGDQPPPPFLPLVFVAALHPIVGPKFSPCQYRITGPFFSFSPTGFERTVDAQPRLPPFDRCSLISHTRRSVSFLSSDKAMAFPLSSFFLFFFPSSGWTTAICRFLSGSECEGCSFPFFFS